MMASLPRLKLVSADQPFAEPVKRIHDGPDVQFFLQSLAYRDITTFILQLNRSMVPRKRTADGTIREFRLDQIRQEDVSPQIEQVLQVLLKLEALMADAPPDSGPRRFGNVSFRKWYKLVEDNVEGLLTAVLPVDLHPAIVELKAYLLGSFGSAQRLDYGTGHELSFVAFLCCLWKIGYFTDTARGVPEGGDAAGTGTRDTEEASAIERQLILCLFAAYLKLIRNLIVTYNLEPAGSHGVWGLDDNSFLPYMFGSAQLSPPLPSEEAVPQPPTPVSGSLPSSPDPSIVTKSNLVDKEADSNLYFGAIKFIYTVKRGPFWEHSPILFDISGIKDGWGKINKGLIKMYDAEVLSKFPVVQHFPFGTLLPWEKDPEAKQPPQTTHQASQPLRDAMAGGSSTNATAMRPPGPGATASSASTYGTRPPPPPVGFVNGATQAPWARSAAAPEAGRMPPRRPLHPHASRPTSTSTSGSDVATGPRLRPVSAATSAQTGLASKTAETIKEEKAQEEGAG